MYVPVVFLPGTSLCEFAVSPALKGAGAETIILEPVGMVGGSRRGQGGGTRALSFHGRACAETDINTSPSAWNAVLFLSRHACSKTEHLKRLVMWKFSGVCSGLLASCIVPPKVHHAEWILVVREGACVVASLVETIALVDRTTQLIGAATARAAAGACACRACWAPTARKAASTSTSFHS